MMVGRAPHWGRMCCVLLAALCGTAAASATCLGSPAAVLNGRWPASAYNAPNGTLATAVCHAGYTSPAPKAMCLAGVWGAPDPPQCLKTCSRAPPPLQGGTWSACANSTVKGAWCDGLCHGATPFGSPAIQCGGGAWLSSSQVGRCSDKPMCQGQPPQPKNAAPWPAYLLDAAVGGSASAVCNPGYFAANQPTSRCTLSGWQDPVPSACARGSVSSGTAFITRSYDTVDVLVCTLRNGTVVAATCVSTTAAEFFASSGTQLRSAGGIAVVGDTVWVTDDASHVIFTARFDAATRKLVAIRANYTDTNPLAVVVDPRSMILYYTALEGVYICPDALTLNNCTLAPLYGAWGLALAQNPARLLVTTRSGNDAVLSCPLSNAGLSLDPARCTVWGPSAIPALTAPFAIAVNGDATAMAVANNNGGGLLVCSLLPGTPPVCSVPSSCSFGGNLGLLSMAATPDGRWYVPSYNAPGIVAVAGSTCALSSLNSGAVGIFITP